VTLVERAFERQLAVRRRKLVEAKHEWIMECHEQGIALLVQQRMCIHSFVSLRLNGRVMLVRRCAHCKFSFIEKR
jgi:hypothetical protein